MFGEEAFLVKFNESYESINYYMRRGWVAFTVLPHRHTCTPSPNGVLVIYQFPARKSIAAPPRGPPWGCTHLDACSAKAAMGPARVALGACVGWGVKLYSIQSPPIDIIWAVMIVWRIRVKIIRTVLPTLCTTIVCRKFDDICGIWCF